MDIVIASTNKNKLLELQSAHQLLCQKFPKLSQYNFLTPEEVKQRFQLGSIPEVEENGASYFENAILKAQVFSRWAGLSALGDDSGLEVEALDGRPGIFSARYAGINATQEEKISKILKELAGLKTLQEKATPDICSSNSPLEQEVAASQFLAKFVCHLVLVLRDNFTAADRPLEDSVIKEGVPEMLAEIPISQIYVNSEVSGQILESPRGDKGFGYDPIFYCPEFGKTYAELEPEQLYQSGFRAKALKELLKNLLKLSVSDNKY